MSIQVSNNFRRGPTTNAAVLDVSQSTSLGENATCNHLRDRFADGHVDRRSTDKTVVDRKPSAQDYDESYQRREEHFRSSKNCVRCQEA